MKSQRLLRSDAASIWSEALRAVDPEAAVVQHVERKGHELRVAGKLYDLRKVRKIWALGAGKAAAPMARALEEGLGRPLASRGFGNQNWHRLALEVPWVVQGRP